MFEEQLCSTCGEYRTHIFKKISGKNKIFIDESGKRWNGLKCPACYARDNRERSRRAAGYYDSPARQENIYLKEKISELEKIIAYRGEVMRELETINKALRYKVELLEARDTSGEIH